MKQTIILFSFLIMLLGGCMWLRQPKKWTFKYYDKHYTPDLATTKLHTSGAYVNNWKKPGDERGSNCRYLVFIGTGEMRVENSSCDLHYFTILNSPKETFGFYRIDGDTLRYSTKSFYRKKQNFGFGIVYYDSIVIEERIYNGKIIKDTYYFKRF